jgi:hypothetical protein
MQQPVLLIQLPVPQIVCQEITGNLPLAAAALRLHAAHVGVPHENLPAIMPAAFVGRAGDRALIDAILAKSPAVVGFTVTVWNVERSLHVARAVKEMRPETTIILGGPDVAADSFFISDPAAAFDFAVEGEGEMVFAALLQGVAAEMIDGLLTPGGRLTRGNIVCQPLPDLDTIHDPFVQGLVQPEADGVIFGEFHRGCKYRCSFCRYHQGRLRGAPAARSREQIAALFGWAHDHAIREIYILDPSLEQRPDFDDFLDYMARINQPAIDLFCELRLDYIDARLAGKLRAAGVRSVEVGLQTISATAIKAAGRRFHRRAFIEGAQALTREGISIRTDVMLGLPDDTPQGMDATLAFLREHDLAHQTQVFRTQVLPGTRLRRQAAQRGILFEQRPPYFIVSTPTWPADELEAASAHAEAVLGISQAPEDRPLIAGSGWQERSYAAIPIAGSDTIFFYGYRLDVPEAAGRMDAESFAAAGSAVTLHCVTTDPRRDDWRCIAAIRRFCAANPFASLSVVIALAPHAPLDILDAVNALFAEIPSPTRYGERMYATTQWPRPERRLFAALADARCNAMHPAWCAAVAAVSGIISVAACPDAKAALKAAAAFDPTDSDYLFLDLAAIPPQGRWPAFFEALYNRNDEPQQILLPAPEMHWALIRWLEERERRE